MGVDVWVRRPGALAGVWDTVPVAQPEIVARPQAAELAAVAAMAELADVSAPVEVTAAPVGVAAGTVEVGGEPVKAAREIARAAPVAPRADSAPLPRPAVRALGELPVTGDASALWDALRSEVLTCTKCALHQTRTQGVLGVGPRRVDWMVIGEAPGAEEDRRGEPFVGRAGHLLDAMLHAIGLNRGTNVYIANVLKSRPLVTGTRNRRRSPPACPISCGR